MKAKRLDQFRAAKAAILVLLVQQDDEPDCSFQYQVTCEDEDSFTLSAANLVAVEEFRKKLEGNVEANRLKAEAMRDRIRSLVDTLRLDVKAKMAITEKWDGHSPPEMEEASPWVDALTSRRP